jgi:ABC-type bacteriocin/lantibiotic exporter with double-glycine peptidase domain
LKNLTGRGAPLRERLWALVFCLFFLFSCIRTSPVKEPEFTRTLENVPFYPQEMYQCGPASLAGVLNYWGIDVSPEEIAGEIYSPSAKGTLNIDMALYVEKKGLKAIQYPGSFMDVKRKIDSGYPLILMVDHGFWVYQQNHFMVALGYHENGIIVHSGKDRQKVIPLKDFLNSWKKTRFWTLWVTPK